jgi:hypothetical protein
MSENGEKFENGHGDICGDDHTDWPSTSRMNVNAAQAEKLILEN